MRLPPRGIEILMRFDYQHLFKPIEKTHATSFFFKIEDKTYIYVGERVFSFEIKDEITEYFSEDGHNDVKYPFALSNENIYYLFYQKYIRIEDYQNSIEEGEYQY